MKGDASPIRRVLAELGLSHEQGRSQYSARCPAHADNSASLSIGVKPDGTVGLTCHAGCRAEAVCSALGITTADLFPRSSLWKPKPAKSRNKAPKTPKTPKAQSRAAAVAPLTAEDLAEATQAAKELGPSSFSGYKLAALYPYRLPNGVTWGWRARYENKAGDKQIKPLHKSDGKWVLKEPAVPRTGKPLYRLPEVLASEVVIFIVEGEKCADLLAAIGIAATTSGGAKSAGKADWSPLAGRECVIWPDNDTAGEQYATDVGLILQEQGCDVRVIDVQALGLDEEGADAADWLAANPTATGADVFALDCVPLAKTTADALFDSLTPLSSSVWEAASTPHPHLFQQRHVGIFPIGEVTVIGSPGRTGKTTVLVAMATQYLLGRPLGGLHPASSGPVVMLSAEDTPTQFARKLSAMRHFIDPKDWPKIQNGFIAPDFDSAELAQLRQLVSTERGHPVVAPEVSTIVAALARFQQATGIGAVLIETASTWNAANEDNPSFRALIAAAKEIARSLNVPVVLTHHVSQSSGSNLSKLDISVADLRGGTTFVDNSRQVALLVNLGSDDNPFPDDDARTVLRRLAAPDETGKLSVLVFLNSSQGEDVPPVFFRWASTEHGPACIEVTPHSGLRGLKWYAVRELVRAAKPSKMSNDKAEKREEVVAIVRSMHRLRKSGGSPPTARAVSRQAGRSDTWATDALKDAVELGLLTCADEVVPRSKGKVPVYRPVES